MSMKTRVKFHCSFMVSCAACVLSNLCWYHLFFRQPQDGLLNLCNEHFCLLWSDPNTVVGKKIRDYVLKVFKSERFVSTFQMFTHVNTLMHNVLVLVGIRLFSRKLICSISLYPFSIE